ncbi:MAG: hypothetical protein ACKVVP_18015 [Chloroflexota bacterium]
MKLLVRIALLLSGLLIPLVTVEGYVRTANPVPSENLLPYPYQHADLARIIAGNAYVSFDRDLGWTPTPGAARRQDGVNYAANRAGLRAERDYELRPAPGTHRISAFGDSYTYCENVELRDCWTPMLEQHWSGSEVLNFGVPAYGPDQAWLRYQRDGAHLDSCGVLIGYMTENVNRVVNRFRPFYKPPDGFVMSKPRFLLRDAGLELLPNPVSDVTQLQDPHWVETMLGPHDLWYFPGVFVPNPLDVFQVVRIGRTAMYRYRREGEINFQSDLARLTDRPYLTQAEAFQVTGRVLLGFYREVLQRGQTPVIVVFGQRSDIENAVNGREKSYRPLLNWLDREGVVYLDVTDELAREVRRTNLRTVIANHYRPRGNEIVARVLAQSLPGLMRGTCG